MKPSKVDEALLSQTKDLIASFSEVLFLEGMQEKTICNVLNVALNKANFPVKQSQVELWVSIYKPKGF